MTFRFAIGLIGLWGAVLWIGPAAPRADEPAPRKSSPAPANEAVSYQRHIAPLLAKYCVSCHGSKKQSAALDLESYKDDAAARRDRKTWEKVVDQLRKGEMPPRDRPQPTLAEKELLIGRIDAGLLFVDCGQVDPGRVTIRRLNRAEYNNTVRDLVGVPFLPANDFPADDVGYGFDNIGDVLSLSPLLVERYLAAADQIAAAAFRDPELKKRILIRQPKNQDEHDACARAILEHFASRAYRRPATPEEVARLIGFVKLAERNGDSFERGIQLAVQATLVSPHFLFRVELDSRSQGQKDVEPVGDFALASRLSYFLWSSMPDEELFGLARAGKLRQPDVLAAQARRLLRDPKAKALADNFASQWLQTRNLQTLAIDRGQFRAFDEPLRAAMAQEVELFFNAVVQEDRSLRDFLQADFTFVNERLARHYGLPGIKGPEFQRVRLQGPERGGVLTMAGVLAVTSNPTRTSPVKRGKWILENILGTPPPPPDPDAGELDNDEQAILSGTLKQRLEKHRANPGCATCHQRMDPLGFALENFDAIGAWRTKDGPFEVDASGTLPDGREVNGPADLRAVLLDQQELFARCVAEKMLTYALGRGTESPDQCALDDIVKALQKNDYRFSSLIVAIVTSDPFRLRKQSQRGVP
ncbi:MAG: DUF1592 domain-containing protein [Gemmataceae bacterium]